MQGRLEHELRIKKNIQSLLSQMPSYASDFYYNIQIAQEPTTCLEYLRKINHFLKYINMNIENVDDGIIGRYFECINYTTDKQGNIFKTSFAYRQSVWTALNQFFTYLMRKRIISSNPMEATERPPKKDEVKRIFLSFEELNLILNSVIKGSGSRRAVARQRDWIERDLLIILLFIITGMRKTALSEINLEDIALEDDKEKILTVTDKRNKTQKYYITEEMEQAIKKWLGKRQLLLGDKKNDALFISARRERLSEKAIYNLVKKYSEEALGYSISPHKLRAAFGSLYYEASGGDIKATCEAMGHSDISTTSIYITKRNDSRKEAQNFMSKNIMKD